MILRELIARMTLDMDRGAFDAADKRISGVKRGLEFAGQAAIALGAALGVGVGYLVTRAADANETLNLMGIVFEDNTERVKAWADEVGAATGRSVFDLREGVTILGNALKGMTGDLEAATDMAESLAARAVDFGSAMNVPLEGAEGAINRFLAGLAGETEPLRRFGINMTVAALDAFALEEGIGKTTAKMDEAEKTQLRYAFLMSKTAGFQGDAANTSEAFANASRALRAAIGDLGTRIGLKFLPAAEGIVRGARSVVQSIGVWIEKSNVLQAAMITFGSIATAIGLRVGLTWAAANLPIVLAALALAALVLIVDDFLVFLQGGDSVIGAFIDSIWGPGSAAEAATNFRAALDDLGYFWTNILVPAAQETYRAVRKWFGEMFDSIGDWVIENQRALMQWAQGVKEVFEDVVKYVRSLLGMVGIEDSAGDKLRKAFEKRYGVEVTHRATTAAQADPLENAMRRRYGDDSIDRARAALDASQPSDIETALRNRYGDDVIARATAAAQGVAEHRAFTAASIPRRYADDGASRGNTQINQTVEVTVPAGTDRTMARDVATRTGEELRRMHRHARAGLSQRAEGG